MRVVLDSIEEIDAFVERWAMPVPNATRFAYSVRLSDGTQFTCKEWIMQDLTVGKQISFTMGTPQDKYGNPTTVDGVYTFMANDPSITITPNDTGDGATVLAGGTVGIASFDISADVDRGEGVRAHTETVQLNLVSGEAVAFVPQFGPESDPV